MSEKKAKKRTVVFNTNVKHNEDLYKVGQKVEVSQEDYEILLEAGVIDDNNDTE